MSNEERGPTRGGDLSLWWLPWEDGENHIYEEPKMEDKVLSMADGLVRIRKFSEDFYNEYPKTPENKLALSKTLLVEASICFLSDACYGEVTEEDAKLALEMAHKCAMLMNDFKTEILKKKRTSTNWRN